MRKTRQLVTLLFCFLSAELSTAQSSPSQQLTPRTEIVRQLEKPAVRTRGISVTQSVQPSIAFSNIQFQFNSHELTQTAKMQISEIAAALKDTRLMDQHFSIVGHTDAVGAANYNLQLSSARANRVLDELVAFGIQRRRLTALGRGEIQLLQAFAPDSARQRRVELINVGRNEE